MPSYTIYANTDDGLAVGGPDTTWDGARNDASPSHGGTISQDYTIGASLSFGDYQSQLANQSFDTSAVTGTLSAASFWLKTTGATSTSTPTWEYRINNWAVGTSFVTGTSYSGLTLIADATVSTPGGAAYVEFPVDTPANISISATFKVTIADSRHASGVAPTSSQRRTVYAADRAGTTDDPYLSVTTSVSTAIAPDEASHSHTADEATVTAFAAVAPADAAHAHSADAATVTPIYAIAPADASHGHAADSVTVTPAPIAIIAADAAHGHSADASTVTLAAVAITPHDALHGPGAAGGRAAVVATIY